MSITGGRGGDGGDGSNDEGGGAQLGSVAGGGGGGGGNVGVSISTGAVNIAQSGVVTGGDGGNGGQGFIKNGLGGGGGGGGGGAGIFVADAASQREITNRGKISGGVAGTSVYGAGGGAGGAGAGGGLGGSASSAAQNGAGVVGSNFTITNYGVIEGGITGVDESTRANAITFTGGVNKLLTTATGQMIGAVEIQAPAITTIEMVSRNEAINNRLLLNGSAFFQLDEGAAVAWSGDISGSGNLVKIGAGTLTISGNNNYAGSTTVTQGVLRAGAENAFSPASAMNVEAGATLDLNDFNQTLASVLNRGTVSLAQAATGTTLTVTGPWAAEGNNARLMLDTYLGDQSSATDRLILSGPGASASGQTQVVVKNLGGLGGQTTGLGIKLVEATGGAQIDAQAFVLSAPVLAGAYSYKPILIAGTAGAANPDVGFYLSSEITSPDPEPVQSYREEVSLYAALPEQLRQANTAMLGNLHQRQGSAVPGASQQRQAWGRMINADRSLHQQGTVSPSSHGRLTGFQAGTDLWTDTSWRAGLYVGQLEGDMTVTGFHNGVQAAGAGSNYLRNQYLAGYLSWQGETGAYADAVLQAGRHRYTATVSSSRASAGKGKSWLASLELGKSFALSPLWSIEPQLQLVHQQLQFDEVELVGARVQQDSHSGWLARTGVRVQGNLASGFQPFARINVYKAGSGTDKMRFIGPAATTDIQTPTGATSLEMTVGGSWQLSPRASLYGELGKLWDRAGASRVSSGVNLSLGVKLRW